MSEVFMKLLLRLAFYCAISLWGLTGNANQWQTSEQEKVAFYINNSAITESDQAYVHRKMRGSAVAYFSKEYGPLPSGNFWQLCFDNTSAQRWIETNTIDEFIQTYAQLAMMYRYGVNKKQLTYADLKQMMVQENNKRSQAIANSQVVYGLANFDFDQYKAHTLSTGFNKVRAQLNKQYPPSPAQLKHAYQQRIHSDFLESSTFAIEAVKLSSKLTNALVKKIQQDLAKQNISQLKTQYQSNKQLTFFSKTFHPISRKSDEFIWSDLIRKIKHKKVGDIFSVQDIDKKNYLIKVSQKTLDTPLPLSDVKHIIKNDLAKIRYQKELDKIIQQVIVSYPPSLAKKELSNTCATSKKHKSKKA